MRPNLRNIPRTLWVSLGIHALAACLLACIMIAGSPPVLKPPGTRHGTVSLVYYAPGGGQPAASHSPAKTHPHRSTQAAPILASAKPKTTSKAPPAPVQAASAFGDGDIEMALLTYGPDPAPDLSTLPAGVSGDVVLDIVIDEHGRVAHVTLVKGLGGGVDQSVIATAEHWTFSPATRDGVAIASSQQLLFHYART